MGGITQQDPKREQSIQSILENAPEGLEESSQTKPIFQELPKFSEFRIRWHILIPFIVLHTGAIAAFWFIDLGAILTAAILWIVTGMFGITVGYHRLLTHQAMKMPKWLERFHIFCGVLAFQLGPMTWARMHRQHHAFSDRMSDPHTQIFGFWYGHIGWAILAHPKIGKHPKYRDLPHEMIRDPFLNFCEKFQPIIFVISLLLLYIFGGLPYLLWAGCFRWVWVSHVTWSVNSFGHMKGYRNFETRDLSTNNPIVALLAFGEGWHNNHHRFPSSAKQGLMWWEFDASWMWIKLLQRLGFAKEVKTPAIYAPPPIGPTI